MFTFDPLYILFILPGLLISLIASILLKAWTSRYINTGSSTNKNGIDTVNAIATKYNLNITLRFSAEELSDNYNPRNKTLTLSNDIAQKPTIASIAIAAHELGHARQDFENNLLMALRSFIVPAISIGTNLGYFMIIFGLILSQMPVAWIGLGLFSFSTLFSLLTLPIELDASSKAMKMIRESNLLSKYELSGAKKVLIAASLTYVAAAITSIGTLLYFAMRVSKISNRD